MCVTAMIMDNKLNPIHEKLLATQGVTGLVEVNPEGLVTKAHGDEAELLGNALVFIGQMADLIGESLGMDSHKEVIVRGKSQSAICLPTDEGLLGVLVNSKVKMAELQPLLNSIRE